MSVCCRALALVALLTLVPSVWCQETTAPDTEAQVLELRTSGYYELVARARGLGLADTGGVAELRRRIAAALQLPLGEEESASSGKTLTINAAQQAEVLTIDASTGGKLVHISGDVQMTLVDNDQKVTHIIEAGELWYDQDSGDMTARGKVVYTMIRESSREVFHGESLTFRLSDSQGVFYGGSSDRSRNVGDKSMIFRYQGDAIRRAASDVILMDSGAITSSLGEDPYYHIQASRIWVLRPGEWGLQNAVLFLGRIPVFWFPFYFQAGDDLVFNPVLRFSQGADRRGTALQTTTYIFGKKARESSPLSFLQVEDSTKDQDKVLRGLFLSRGKPIGPAAPTGWSLKVLSDFYARLGFLGGIDATLPGLMDLKTAKFTGGIGFTRTIGTDGLPYSTSPFDALLAPAAQSQWNGSSFGSLRLPFRWGGNLDLGSDFWSFSAQFGSDPLFWSDLTSSRSENFSLLSLAGLGVASSTAVQPAISSLQWKGNLNLPAWVPGLQASVQGSWTWGVQKAVPARTTQDPEASFFVPTQLFFPNINVQWNADLLKLVPTFVRDRIQPALPELVSIEASAVKNLPPAPTIPPIVGDSDFLLITPPLMASLATALAPATWSQSLLWTLNPTFRLDTRFDNSQVFQAQDAQGKVQSSRWVGSWDGRLVYSGVLSDGALTLSDTLSLHQQAQQAWYLSPDSTPDFVALSRTQDQQQTNSLLLDTLAASWRPLAAVPALAASQLSYRLATKLWESTAEAQTLVDWTTSTVTAHQVTAQGVWQLFGPSPVIKLGASGQATLGPLPTDSRAATSFEFQDPQSHLLTKLQWKNLGTQWVSDPWESTLEWTPFPGFTAKEVFLWNLDQAHPQSSVTELAWAGWNFQYRHLQALPYQFDVLARRWTTTGVLDFVPQEFNTRYNLTVPLVQDWKNRQSFSGNLNLAWPINLQQYSQMPLSLSFGLNYKLYRFLDLQISETVVNRTVFRYFPFLVDSFGQGTVTSVDFLGDVVDSLSFWDDTARRRAGFKMGTLSVGLVHYLEDWQIKLDYSGSPQLVGTTTPQFEWTGTLSLLVQWYPVPELKTQMTWDRDGTLTIPRNSP